MSKFTLLHHTDAEAIAQAAAIRLCDTIKAKGDSTFTIALSGGRIANPFYKNIASIAQDQALDLSQVHFFWADERCVPPTDPESNFKTANELLFLPLDIQESHIHRIAGEKDPKVAVADAIDELTRIASDWVDGTPVIDLAILGMGEDGHTASLFPEEPEDERANKALFRDVIAVKPPPQRVTMGYKVLIEASEAWVLAPGAAKEAAMRDITSEGSKLPLGQIIQGRSNTDIYTDIVL